MSAWLGETSEIEQTRVQTAGRPPARFTQIIRTGPDELPEDEVLVADGIPGIKPRPRLASIDNAVRISGMVLVVAVFRIVIPHHIHSIGILRLVRHHDTCQSSGHGTGSVHGTYTSSQALGDDSDTHGIGSIRLIAPEHRLVDFSSIKNGMRIRVVRIIHFIADTPQEDAGMVAVATYHIGHVPFYPLLEEVESTVIIRSTHIPALYPFAFWKLPFVRDFIHYKKSQAVTQFIKNGGLWVVAHADGIYANPFQVIQTAFPYLRRHYCTQHSCIMMQAYTFYLHPVAVEGKTFVGIKFQRTQSHFGLTAVNAFAIGKQFGFQCIQIRIIQIPTMGFGHFQVKTLLGNAFFSIGNTHTALCHLLSGSIVQCSPQFQFVGSCLVLLHLYIDRNDGLLVCQRSGMPAHTPLRNMCIGSSHQPYIAIDARPRIPT